MPKQTPPPERGIERGGKRKDKTCELYDDLREGVHLVELAWELLPDEQRDKFIEARGWLEWVGQTLPQQEAQNAETKRT